MTPEQQLEQAGRERSVLLLAIRCAKCRRLIGDVASTPYGDHLRIESKNLVPTAATKAERAAMKEAGQTKLAKAMEDVRTIYTSMVSEASTIRFRCECSRSFRELDWNAIREARAANRSDVRV